MRASSKTFSRPSDKKDALDKSGTVIAHAVKSLRLRRTTLAEKMRKYQIDRDPDSRPASD
jgi:DNA-binding NtrC family response regulator